MLMPPLIQKWNTLKDDDKDLFPLLEVRTRGWLGEGVRGEGGGGRGEVGKDASPVHLTNGGSRNNFNIL